MKKSSAQLNHSLVGRVNPKIPLSREVVMIEISTLLKCLEPVLSRTSVKQLGIVSEALLCLSGRVSMLGLSRWSGQGGSYRTIQRFYHSALPWCRIHWSLVRSHLVCEADMFLLAGDETTVTKSGKTTYGLGRFFSSIYNRAVPGLGFFSLSLISVKRRKAYPIVMEQSDPRQKKTTTSKPAKTKATGKRGRPVGSKNKKPSEVALSPYLLWIQGIIKHSMALMGQSVKLAYFVYDGAFGNNPCLQMTRQCGLHLISKLHCNAALYFPYQGAYCGKGPKRKYGDKLDYENLPETHRKASSVEHKVRTDIYQMILWHKDFSKPLNITVIHKTNLVNRKQARVVLFSSDLELGCENIILYYRLRFQIEFTFRDAKQHWGLEDFINVKQQAVNNAANLSIFMVNLSQTLATTMPTQNPFSVLDIKARFHAHFYLKNLLKMTPQIDDPILIRQLYHHANRIGCIHRQALAA